ncbi:hypothetical protein RchiOBHm_Chr1g0336851 [Rosa chinensis]|uniref:Uncharacterized protein n=1 Tax=Rosa chinensis TaxID=74649 RepID=A0A2P6SCS2_ROSCH|nr:hypothetical protein RchiOBHm_Chr1g0336851 [Rosa chinensis]
MLSISWAYFAEESFENRHVKVQRPFFAAGCFALSDDFAGVMLEMLVHMMNLSGTLATIRSVRAPGLCKNLIVTFCCNF